jgi:hypothetical protein
MTGLAIRRLRRCVLCGAIAVLAPAASAHAAALQLGTTNTSNAPTTLTGNSSTGPELTVANTNSSQPALEAQATGASEGAFGVLGVLTASAPAANSAAVRGQNSSTNSYGYGVWGSQAGYGVGVYGSSKYGRGVRGESPYGSGGSFLGSGIGVLGHSLATNSTGVFGEADYGVNAHAVSGSSLQGIGVYGVSGGMNRTGVRGEANNGNYAAGVTGTTSSGAGVYGFSSGGSGQGVSGNSAKTNGIGVIGQANNGTLAYGVYGTSKDGRAVDGYSQNGYGGYFGGKTGVHGTSSVENGRAVDGYNPNGYGGYFDGYTGVYGKSSAFIGTAVWGEATGSAGNGVAGVADGASAYGVWGQSSSGQAVRGDSPNGYAGFFNGKVQVNGTLSAQVKNFKIDDPLDPAHKYLVHSSVESPDMKDVYDGIVVTDGRGFATVTMPPWFQALNRSFRYQLTIVGRSFAQAIVWRELAHNRFTIRTNAPGVKVSWQVTGIRHDPYANDHRIRVEVPKPAGEQGKYVYPQGYGKSQRAAVGYRKPHGYQGLPPQGNSQRERGER